MAKIAAGLPQIRWIPVTVAFAAIAFGAHAGEVVKGVTKPKVTAPAKPHVSAPQTRSEVRFTNEMSQVRPSTGDEARQIELRERLAEASERRIDTKLQELRNMQTTQTQQQSARTQETNQQLASLVKVYEQMKPKDAARIFEKLDMDVQLAVATKMREQKMAAIMAQMSPESARALTMEMALQAKISRKI